MSIYPYGIDDDTTIVRVDDNITEIGGLAINQERSAIFAVEDELGVQPSGSAGSVANRLNVSLNPDGTIRASALAAIGLATLPIVDNQVGSNAGIKEYKLSLDFSTADLHTAILANQALLNSLNAFSNSIYSDLRLHIAGASVLSDGYSPGRHVLSQVDINKTPFDSRDPSYIWTGLLDKNGNIRTATQAAAALQQINDDLVNHETTLLGAHNASAIAVDTSRFIEIPQYANNAQKMFNYLDEAEVLNMGTHRATQHSNGIPQKALSQSYRLSDGYSSSNIVPPTPVITYLVHSPNTGPVDDLSIGDDLVSFSPNNTSFLFDSQFSQVKIGDIIHINYGNNIEASFPVESIRNVPGAEWVVRINGINLFDVQLDGYATARIDRARFDTNTVGVLAVASANANAGTGPGSYANILSSVIVGHPQGATAFGLGFDPGQLNATHYNLYLEFYPTGNPADHITSLPGVDVTGNAGITPGAYTLYTVVDTINNNFRENGFNYRFIAFAHDGEVGIMLADIINGASFAIIRGNNSSGTLLAGAYTNNVIGGNSVDDFDALGFGPGGANIASPSYQTGFSDTTAAQLPTKIISPVKNRNYYVNGQRGDSFVPTYLANSAGYWDGYISARNPVGISTVEVTYTINMDLAPSGLKAGKTIIIQPAISFADTLYNDVDYGRFIIKNVTYATPCGGSTGYTEITVINGLYATGYGFGFSALPGLPVQIYFSNDSVSFDAEEVIDQSPIVGSYSRLHEIYIDQFGHTFSHERARLPKQTATSTKLDTTNFHIVNVSPKLRGYQGSNPLVFDKFVRFYVTDYDSASGSFDGYLGQLSGSSSVIYPGQVVNCRKNVPARFYDNTGIDYVELIFNEIDIYPGTTIAAPRYVDIELFPSLQNTEESMILATCEVNWPEPLNQFIIQNVRDARQFGSISETDFTDSAIDFVSAGDRMLHENGVIQGLSLDYIGLNGEVFMNGGIALVNGKFTTVNNMSVTIPNIYNQDTTDFPLPQTIEWAICVNKNNDLIPVLLTVSRSQYFATIDGVNNYYIQSATLSEIVNVRKDLTPIAIATASVTGSGITISSVIDIRRFIVSEGLTSTLTWTADQKTIGHFSTFTALQNWVNNYNSSANIVQLRGTFNLSSSVVMTGFTQAIIFDGTAATINVNGPVGFVLGGISGITLRNFLFNYNPTGLSYTFGNYINSGNGCIYMNSSVSSSPANLSNITIEDCTFICTTAGTQRPPFINAELHSSAVLDRPVIKSCYFFDLTTTQQAAIAIIDLNDNGAAIEPALVSNCIIRDNICAQNQGIYITSVGAGIGLTYASPGLSVFNTKIQNNNCDIIGFLTSSARNTAPFSFDGYVPSVGMTISDNSCTIIATANSYGFSIAFFSPRSITYATGDVIIRNNFSKWIHAVAQNHQGDGAAINSTLITGNILEAYDYNYLTTRFVDEYLYNSNMAIGISGDAVNTAQVIISNNIVKSSPGGAFAYNHGIFSMQSATITANDITGILAGGNGISVFGFPVGQTYQSVYAIRDNKISGISGGAYVGFGPSSDQTSATTGGIIAGNIFDVATAMPTFPTSWTIKENIGQIGSVTFAGDEGFIGLSAAISNVLPYLVAGANVITGGYPDGYIGNVWAGVGPTISDNTITTNQNVMFQLDNTGNAFEPNSFIWSIPLQSFVPYGAYITSINVNVLCTTQIANGIGNIGPLRANVVNAPNTTNGLTGNNMLVNFGSSSMTGQINTNPYTALQVISIPYVFAYPTCPMVPSNVTGRFPKLSISSNAMDAGNGQIWISPVTIVYRW